MLEKIQTLLASLSQQNSTEGFCHEIERTYLTGEELKPYIYFEKYKYTRNLIFQNTKFELMTLCWGPYQETPIHDHSGSLGVMKVIEGELHETLYKASATDSYLEEIEERKAVKDSITSIEDSVGFHKIANKSKQPAISLHLYAKPIESFYIYNSKNLERCIKIPCFDSEFGEKNQRPTL